MAQRLPETQDSLILLVEDDPYIREFLALMLNEEGFRTAEAANGGEALRLAAHQQPSLVVSDIMMPVLNGYDLVMRLRQDATLCTVPVILMTAAHGVPPVDVPLVRKPFDIDRLLAVIRDQLARPVNDRHCVRSVAATV